jgi:hypothetical protein
MTTATANRVMEQALALPKAKKKILLKRLWQTLAPTHRMPPTPEEIMRRVESVRNGRAVTYSLEEVRRGMDERRAAAIKKLQKKRPTQ